MKIRTDDKLNGLPNAGNRRGSESQQNITWLTDDKLTLNDHERITQIYSEDICLQTLFLLSEC